MNLRTLVAGTLGLALAGCSAPYTSVFIGDICAPPTPDATTGACLYPATCDAVLASPPRLDVSTAVLDFRLPLEVGNILTDNSNAGNGAVNNNDAFITSFEMQYAGGPAIPNRLVNASFRVPVTGSQTYVVPLISATDFPALQAAVGSGTLDMVVNVRANGNLASGTTFTTAWFQVPVRVCNLCLQTVCGTGTVFFASCPSAAPGSTSPGQTATVSCVATTAASLP